MVTVVFEHVRVAGEAADGQPTLSGQAHPGSRLLDLCDEVEAPIVFSCRDASCGSCLVEVLAGETLLEPADPTERRTLTTMRATAQQRLACRARICGQGTLRLRAAEAHQGD